MSDVGLVAQLVEKVFSWFTDEAGYLEMQKRWKGDRLEKAANEALRTWKLAQTTDNWRAYKDAEAALVNWSNTP